MEPYHGVYDSAFRFAKIFVGPETGVLRLPDTFMAIYGVARPAWLTLRSWDNRAWPVQVVEVHGRLLFETGWPAFRDMYHLVEGDQLSFAYDQEATMYVAMYGTDGALKQRSMPLLVQEPEEIHVGIASPGGDILPEVEESLRRAIRGRIDARKQKEAHGEGSGGSVICNACLKRGKSVCMCRSKGKLKREQPPPSSDDDELPVCDKWGWPSPFPSPPAANSSGLLGSENLALSQPKPEHDSLVSTMGLHFSPEVLLSQHIADEETTATVGLSSVAADVRCRGESDHVPSGGRTEGGASSKRPKTSLTHRPVAVSLKKRFTCFIEMKESFVTDRYEVVIPRLFGNANLSRGMSQIKLAVGPVEKWNVYCVLRDEKATIVYGWEKFCKDHKLKVGDMCKFEVQSHDEDVWNVSLFAREA